MSFGASDTAATFQIAEAPATARPSYECLRAAENVSLTESLAPSGAKVHSKSGAFHVTLLGICLLPPKGDMGRGLPAAATAATAARDVHKGGMG